MTAVVVSTVSKTVTVLDAMTQTPHKLFVINHNWKSIRNIIPLSNIRNIIKLSKYIRMYFGFILTLFQKIIWRYWPHIWELFINSITLFLSPPSLSHSITLHHTPAPPSHVTLYYLNITFQFRKHNVIDQIFF